MSSHQSMAKFRSPSPTTKKKVMTWTEIQSSIRDAETPRGTRRLSSMTTTPSAGSAKQSSPSPHSSDPAYLAARRKRLEKKTHLLGNRGKYKSPNARPDSATLSKSEASGKKCTPSSSGRKPLRENAIRKNSVSSLLMTPSPSFPKSRGRLSFSVEKPSSHTKNSLPRRSSIGSDSASDHRLLSAMKTPPLARSSGSKTPPRRSFLSRRTSSTETPASESKSDHRSLKTRTPPRSRPRISSATTPPPSQRRSTVMTPPRPTGTPRRRVSSVTGTPKKHTPGKPSPLSVQREESRRLSSYEGDLSPTRASENRRNLDKRTARLRYSEHFASEISFYREQRSYLNNGSNHENDNNVFMRGNQKHSGVSFFVRKRPIFDYELDRGEFDVVSVDGCTRYDSDRVIVHNGHMHADMRRKLLKHVSYACTAAFDQHCTNDNLYLHVGQPLVQEVASGSGIATLVMYGQTGSGKTHTMTGIEERAADDLFTALEETKNAVVKLQFVELAGKFCYDLLDRKKGDVRIVDQPDGSVRLVNARSIRVSSAEELSHLMGKAKGRRATEATDVNGVSSRSHAVCQITVSLGSNTMQRGILTLVDCAGSERRNDGMYHSSERQKESTAINASLYALKECIRARSQRMAFVPYRDSSLTRILRETLEKKGSKLAIVATVAPNATDTEHTLETLKVIANLVWSHGVELDEGDTQSPTAAQLSANNNKMEEVVEEERKAPKQWTHDELVTWMGRNHLLPTNKSVPPHVDGQSMMRMSQLQLRTLIYDPDWDVGKDKALFQALRAESESISKAQRNERKRTAQYCKDCQ